MPFLKFIANCSINRKYLIAAFSGTAILLTIFKVLYPFADYFSDSYSYIFAAGENLNISIWPIGYSKFLGWFHFFTTSDTILVVFQYIFYMTSSLYFYFTVLYFYPINKSSQIILFICLFFNPLFLYICNYINSDPIFLALSIFWLTELIWILNKPTITHIITQAFVLFACFAVRNNAYIYPIVTILVYLMSNTPLKLKLIGASLGFALIIPFVLFTRNEAEKLTGTKQFSLFTGWQLANNALYSFEWSQPLKNPSKTSEEIEKLAEGFYSSVFQDFREEYLLQNPGNFFIQSPYSPLKVYMTKHYEIKDNLSLNQAWGKSSVAFAEYGKSLILENKVAYFYQFMVPNLKNYFIPHLEKLSEYNLGQNLVDIEAQRWFKYKTNLVRIVYPNLQGYILYGMPFLFLLINAYWLLNTISFLIYRQFKSLDRQLIKLIWLTIAITVSNIAFSVFATIIVMRYQAFPLIVTLLSALLIANWLDKRKEKANPNPTEHRKEIHAFTVLAPEGIK